MKVPTALRERIAKQYGSVIDLKRDPDVFDRIVAEIAASLGESRVEKPAGEAPAPFGVSWMDSWVAHWVYTGHAQAAGRRGEALGQVMRDLVDLKFDQRLDQIRAFIRDYRAEPPDGGTPEPGVPPPAGPAIVFSPPDGGTPEPGVPPPAGPAVVFAPPDGGTPEPGVPPAGPSPTPVPPDGGPPEPGVPPTGPEAALFGENPWILYWFVSLKAPQLLDVIDAHLSRRMSELGAGRR
jgi:hypothetical protein